MARSRASRVARRVLPDHRAAGLSAPAVSCSQRRAAAAHTTPESASGPAGRALRGAVPVVGAKPGLSTSILPFPHKYMLISGISAYEQRRRPLTYTSSSVGAL